METVLNKEIIIKEVIDKEGLKDFIKLPYTLYDQDEPWVPPLDLDFKKYIRGENNFLNQSGPNTRILAYKDGEVVGRLLVGINQPLNEAKSFKEGYISLFESIEDYEVAFHLLEYA